MENILIKDILILPMDRPQDDPLLSGSIGIRDGHIRMLVSDAGSVEDFVSSCGDNLRTIDGRGMLAMPGLVNIHNHVSMSLMRGYADDIPLFPWLNDYIWPFEAKLTTDDIRLGAELGIAEMLLGGTTCFVDMYWSEISVAEAVEKLGIRAVLSPTYTDAKYDEFETDVNALIERYGEGRNPLVSMMIAPHSPYTCSPGNLIKTKKLADRLGVNFNIHVAETMAEVRTIAERFGKSPVKHLDDIGVLDENTLMVHCVHVSEEDIAIMRDRGVSVAHNPQSNMKLSSGTSPVYRMAAEEINVGIGTDGPCSNNDLDMWDELRSASFLQKLAAGDPCVLPAYEVLRMATVCGARAIGLDDKIGTLAEGMQADIILLDILKPHLFPRHDVVANLVYSSKSSDVDTVIVGGRIVVEGGTLLTAEIGSIMETAGRRASKLSLK